MTIPDPTGPRDKVEPLHRYLVTNDVQAYLRSKRFGALLSKLGLQEIWTVSTSWVQRNRQGALSEAEAIDETLACFLAVLYAYDQYDTQLVVPRILDDFRAFSEADLETKRLAEAASRLGVSYHR